MLSEVAPFVGGGATAGRLQPAEPDSQGTDLSAAHLIARIVRASADFDPIGLQTQLDLAATTLGLAGCVDQILLPATRHLRGLLATGERTAAQDLMATEAVRNWLDHRRWFAPPPLLIGPILLACGPRDRDTLSLESMALLLRFHRWPCRVLGERVSTFSLTIAAQAAEATAVVVTSGDSRGLPNATVSIMAIDALGIPVFFTGAAFARARRRHRLPGQYLGAHLEDACAIVLDSLAPALPNGDRQVPWSEVPQVRHETPP